MSAPLFDGFSEHHVDVGDAEIRCFTGGSGRPVLLLHGYPQNCYLWARVAAQLAERHTVVAADLRGYGASPVTSAEADVASYSFRAMAADQMALMRTLGHERFAVVGHDRGGRTAHRMALDEPGAVDRLAVLDIVPTIDMWQRMDKDSAAAYWHWQLLAVPAPFPETLIGHDPDFFFESCVESWGATRLADLDGELLERYRRDWRRPEVVHASCQDYRAAASVDLEHDRADQEAVVGCPTLALWGAEGRIGRLFDVAATWRRRCPDLTAEALPGAHFFVDQHPGPTARALLAFLDPSR